MSRTQIISRVGQQKYVRVKRCSPVSWWRSADCPVVWQPPEEVKLSTIPRQHSWETFLWEDASSAAETTCCLSRGDRSDWLPTASNLVTHSQTGYPQFLTDYPHFLTGYLRDTQSPTDRDKSHVLTFSPVAALTSDLVDPEVTWKRWDRSWVVVLSPSAIKCFTSFLSSFCCSHSESLGGFISSTSSSLKHQLSC